MKVWGADYKYNCAPTSVKVEYPSTGKYKLTIPIKLVRTNGISTTPSATLQVVFNSSELEGTFTYNNGSGSLVGGSGASYTYFKENSNYHYLNSSKISKFIISKRGEHVYEIKECTLYFGDATNSYECKLSYNANTLSDESSVEPFVFVDCAVDKTKTYLMKNNISNVQAQYNATDNKITLSFNISGTNSGSSFSYETTLILNNSASLAGTYSVDADGAKLDPQSTIVWVQSESSSTTRYPVETGTLLSITHVSGSTYRLSGALCARKSGSTEAPPFYNFGSTGLEFTCRINYTIPDDENKTAFLNQIKTSGADFDLTLGRTLSSAYYNTFCSPIAISAEEVTTIFGTETDIRTLESSSYDEGKNQLTLTFSENSLTEIEAGKPYLIMPGREVANPQFTNVATSRLTADAQTIETTNADFYGILAPYTLSEADPTFLFLAANNQLMWGDTGTLNGMRAYFKIKGISDIQQASMVPARMQFGSKTTPTDLEEVNDAQSTMHDGKYMYQGHFVILHNGKKYNL